VEISIHDRQLDLVIEGKGIQIPRFDVDDGFTPSVTKWKRSHIPFGLLSRPLELRGFSRPWATRFEGRRRSV
jgi:hypothetical protein